MTVSGRPSAPPSLPVPVAEVSLRVTVAERARIAQGIFVRLDLPHAVLLADGFTAANVLVGRAGGSLRAYANVCRHKAIPLDARGGTELGVMADDRVHLICDSHGAVYRPEDGMCTQGPCAGLKLFAFDVEERGDNLLLSRAP